MKKILVLIAVLILVLSLSACKNESVLISHTSELRSDIFVGQNDDIKIKADYGFRENPFINDGNKEKIIYKLNFRLLNKEMDNATYTINFDLNDRNYTDTFTYSPISHTLFASFEIENFDKKEFDINVSVASDIKKVHLHSLVPENTITYKEALSVLEKEQSSLISYFSDENGFNGEIHCRIIIRNNKPYWYIGLIKDNTCQKALLMDGITSEILAVREIY